MKVKLDKKKTKWNKIIGDEFENNLNFKKL
jgi:hypothetical protein